MQKHARSKCKNVSTIKNTLTTCVFLHVCFCHNDIMLDEYGFEVYEEGQFPLAYLITIRTFGTWLHGDERHSVERHGKNVYGTLDIPPNEELRDTMKSKLTQNAVVLDEVQRKTVESAITELCEKRKYDLLAINTRTNHVHVVVAAQAKPERIADAFKAFSTKQLREQNLFSKASRIWSRGRSRRYLWKPRQVELAKDYVLYGQGDLLFEVFAERRTK